MRQKMILVIEDEPDIVLLLRAQLESEGYQVIACPNGMQGISMTHAEKPDLILLDMMMPSIDGFQVCQILKHNPLTSYIPVIWVTGSQIKDLEKQAKEAGAADLIRKPFELEELIGKIKKCMRVRRQEKK